MTPQEEHDLAVCVANLTEAVGTLSKTNTDLVKIIRILDDRIVRLEEELAAMRVPRAAA